MIKNRPWQVIALIAAHALSLAYVFYRFLFFYSELAYAPPYLILPAALGLITLAFLFTRQKAGPVLECLYFTSLAFSVHNLDLLVYAAAIAYLIVCGASRRYYSLGGIAPARKPDDKSAPKRLTGIKLTIILVMASLAVSAAAIPVVNNLNKVFYISHSRSDYKALLAYVGQNYAGAEVNDKDYKEFGCVYLYMRGERGGRIEISDGVIEDRIVLDKLENELEQRLAEYPESGCSYSVSLGMSGGPRAYIGLRSRILTLGEFAESMLEDGKLELDRPTTPENPAAFRDPALYAVVCELINGGYEVIIDYPSGYPSIVSIARTHNSVLFPFLNPKTEPAEPEEYFPEYLKFAQTYPEDEFYSQVGAYIGAMQAKSNDYDRALAEELENTSMQRRFNLTIILVSAFVTLLINAPLYTLRSIGCNKLMKSCGLKPVWLAWIPYLWVFCIAIIAEDIDRRYERHKPRLRRMIVTAICSAVFYAALVVPSMIGRFDQYGSYSLTWGIFATGTAIACIVSIIVFMVTYFSALWQIFIQYWPLNATAAKVLSLLFGTIATPIILFLIRNNVPLLGRPPAPVGDGEFPYGYEKPVTAGKQDLGGMYSNLSNRLYNAGLYTGGEDFPPPDETGGDEEPVCEDDSGEDIDREDSVD